MPCRDGFKKKNHASLGNCARLLNKGAVDRNIISYLCEAYVSCASSDVFSAQLFAVLWHVFCDVLNRAKFYSVTLKTMKRKTIWIPKKRQGP